MAFNRTAAKAAGYSDAEIDSYLSSRGSTGQETSGLSRLLALLGGVGGTVGGPVGRTALAGLSGGIGQQISENVGGRPGDPMALAAAVNPAAALFRSGQRIIDPDRSSVEKAMGSGVGQQLAQEAIYKLLGLLPTKGNITREGQKLEAMAGESKPVASEQITRRFGSDLLERAHASPANPRERRMLLKIIEGEKSGMNLGNLGRGPTTADIFEYKRALSPSAKWGKEVPENVAKVYRELQRGYGDILSESLPGYGDVAKKYAFLKNLQSGIGHTGAVVSRALPAAIGYGIGASILQALKGLFE